MGGLGDLFSHDELLNQRFKPALMNRIFFRERIRPLPFAVADFCKVGVVVACETCLVLVNRPQVLGPAIVKLTLLLSFLLLNCFVDDCLF